MLKSDLLESSMASLTNLCYFHIFMRLISMGDVFSFLKLYSPFYWLGMGRRLILWVPSYLVHYYKLYGQPHHRDACAYLTKQIFTLRMTLPMAIYGRIDNEE
jgi:hypothetical protein